ncbi:G patch domain-containing protein 1 homolog [Lutzomyia longipalpis]|uniref:Putative rna binding protein n=1 Tax=Lutzomyia longipalpis TaxID=7200 RepID=A0A1B0CUK5_LUTLO|nr:G patch domain-containing protein 1 homolog [Lutzomyia longipalpis]
MEENDLCPYGTPLDPIEEDQVPTKRPIMKEDQIAVDVNGRRRFHGAFTGGFSAGYWNTVGSKEGWNPQTFRSSRQEKAGKIVQNIEDFMDNEDMGEFGIAPRRIQTQEDFTIGNSSKKRTYTVAFASTTTEGILHKLLAPAKDNIGTRLLRKMGWREGQGVGVRLTRREKKEAKTQHLKEQQIAKRYGCEMIPSLGASKEDSTSEDSDMEVTFAPDDYNTFAIAPKNNVFGLGYSGLDRSSMLLNKTSDAFAIIGKDNKKMLITGKGFGVGAMEDDDEDIYCRDDMSQYDFSLEDHKTPKTTRKDNRISLGVIEGFLAASDAASGKFSCKVFRIELPCDYQPRNFLIRKSRFAPLPLEVEKQLKQNSQSDKYALSDTKVVQKENTDHTDSSKTQLKVVDEKQISHTQLSKPFKFFLHDVEKQERFEKFLQISKTATEEVIKEFFQTHQPLHLSQFDRQTEQREFLQARKMHRPLAELMSDRFVSESSLNNEKSKEGSPEKPLDHEVPSSNIEGPDNTGYYSKRTKLMWKPHALLCQRFNIPEPYGGLLGKEEKSKKSKSSNIFQILGDPVKKIDFTVPKDEFGESSKELTPIANQPPIAKKLSNISQQSERNPHQKTKEPQKSDKETPPLINRPKTELETAVLDAKDKHPADKKDLFRAIFEDSDESENDDTPQQPIQKEEVNPLRNPAKPQGIFSKIFFVRKATEKKRQEQENTKQQCEKQETQGTIKEAKEEDDNLVFGPKLPPLIESLPPKATPIFSTEGSCSAMNKSGSKREKWVEKSLEKKKKKKEKHKKEKKHKKNKRKHKIRK